MSGSSVMAFPSMISLLRLLNCEMHSGRPVSPLFRAFKTFRSLSSQTLSHAVQTYLSGLDHYDSLFSVKRLQTRLWNDLSKPINHDPDKLIRTQDLLPVFEENSCIYIFSRKTLQKRGSRIGERPLLFEMDPIESLDIDEEEDFQIAELLFLNRSNLGI